MEVSSISNTSMSAPPAPIKVKKSKQTKFPKGNSIKKRKINSNQDGFTTDNTDNDTDYETDNDSRLSTNVKALNEKNFLLIDIVKRQESFLEELKSKLESKDTIIDNLVNKVNTLSNDVQELKTKQAQFSAVPKPFNTLFKSPETSNKEAPTTEKVNLLHALRVEASDVTSRESNILIMGASSPETSLSTTEKNNFDKNTVDKILNTLKVDSNQVKNIYRFNKKSDSIHPPIIRVTFQTKETAHKALKSGKLLINYKDETNSKIFVNPDLTQSQRLAEKVLIKERNRLNDDRQDSEKLVYHYGIRRGIIRKINNSN